MSFPFDIVQQKPVEDHAPIYRTIVKRLSDSHPDMQNQGPHCPRLRWKIALRMQLHLLLALGFIAKGLRFSFNVLSSNLCTRRSPTETDVLCSAGWSNEIRSLRSWCMSRSLEESNLSPSQTSSPESPPAPESTPRVSTFQSNIPGSLLSPKVSKPTIFIRFKTPNTGRCEIFTWKLSNPLRCPSSSIPTTHISAPMNRFEFEARLGNLI